MTGFFAHCGINQVTKYPYPKILGWLDANSVSTL